MKQLISGITEENKVEPKEKAKGPLSIGDTVKIVEIREKSKKLISYKGIKHFLGKKGKIIQILGTKEEPYQGVKVRFPKVSTNDQKVTYGSELAFYSEEVEKVDEKIEFKEKEKKHILKGKALERRRAVVQHLREEGESTENLAKKFDVSKRTIWRWLKG